jgi:pimeloyl-ACP methyl ester carboxylesterase
MGRLSAFGSDAGRDAYVTAYDTIVAGAPVPTAHADVPTPFGTTHVLLAGAPDGPPLVALHGKTLSATMWLAHLDTLAASHRVVMVDTIGDLGRSVATRSMRSRADVVAWLDAVVEGLGTERAAFLGHSYGAWMATTYALAQPDAVDRLALLAPAAVFVRVKPAWIARAVSTYVVRPTPARVRRFMESTCTAGTVAAFGSNDFGRVVELHVTGAPAFRAAAREAVPTTYRPDALSVLTMPVLLVVGRDETVCDGSRSAVVARAGIPHARIELLDDANHSVFADQQEAVDRILAEFLA